MKKNLIFLTALALLLMACLSAGAEEPAVRDLFDLWDYGAESPEWAGFAIPVAEGILMASPAGLPDSAEHLAVTDGVNIWDALAVLPDHEGRLNLIFYDPGEVTPRCGAWPMLPGEESVPASSCYARYGDEMGSRINRRVLGAEGLTRNGKSYYILTLSDPVPEGSPVLTYDGQLAGVIVAQWAEGNNRALMLAAEEIPVSLGEAAGLLAGLPEWGEAPEGLNVTLEKNSAVIDWTEMTLPEKAEGESLYLVLVDTGNDYLNYYPAESESRRLSLLLTPGRVYVAGVTASAAAPDSVPEAYATISVPPADPLTDYGFRSKVCAVAAIPEGGLAEGGLPVVVMEVTEELLRSGRACFYSSSCYEVEEEIEGKSLLVTLTDPEGVNYTYESAWLYAPEYMEADVWYLPLKDVGLTEALDRKGYPRGEYRMAFYVDGDLGDEFAFELK